MKISTYFGIALIICLMLIGHTSAGFWDWFSWFYTSKPPAKSNECLNPGTCLYDNGVDSQFLVTCNGVCVCLSQQGIMDKSSWNVVWDGKSACNMPETGPCGISKDGIMMMGCQPGLQCLQKRCRSPSKLGKTPKDSACYDDIDCEKGLVCQVGKFEFGPRRFCKVPQPVPL